MHSQIYNKQVTLLLKVLPEVAKENNFALYGGTAINLFIRDMPRLSVDIDLTYIPIEPRNISLSKIKEALDKIKARIENIIPDVKVQHKEEAGKLLVSRQGVTIKLEVNLVDRGLLGISKKQFLSKKVELAYDVFTAIQVVSFGQLYGGKICAALDRQHPRDLFDIKYLLANEGLSREVMIGFLLSLVSNSRPIYEILNPNFLDQRQVMNNQFLGMTSEIFTYDDFEQVRVQLVNLVNNALTLEDRKFLLSIKNVNPDWKIHNFDKFPAVRWKLQNLNNLKKLNLKKHDQQLSLLQTHLAVDLVE